MAIINYQFGVIYHFYTSKNYVEYSFIKNAFSNPKKILKNIQNYFRTMSALYRHIKNNRPVHMTYACEHVMCGHLLGSPGSVSRSRQANVLLVIAYYILFLLQLYSVIHSRCFFFLPSQLNTFFCSSSRCDILFDLDYTFQLQCT